MKSRLFVRPNLKLFLLGAALILVVEHLLSSSQPADTQVLVPANLSVNMVDDQQLEQLINYALEVPTSDNYVLISECLLRRGDPKGAMRYLRKATLAAQLEEEE